MKYSISFVYEGPIYKEKSHSCPLIDTSAYTIRVSD